MAGRSGGRRYWILLGLAGFGVGACVGLALVWAALGLTTRASAPEKSPRPLSRGGIIPTQPVCLQALSLLDEAECLGRRFGMAEQAIALLSPRLGELETDADRIRAYRLLADAESYLYHYQLAAGYLERLYALEPSADVLYQLAEAYYLGADHEHAAARYAELAAWADAEADPYRQVAETRLEDLARVLGTPTAPAGSP